MRLKRGGGTCSTVILLLGELRKPFTVGKRKPKLCYPGQQKHVSWSIHGPESKSPPSEKEAGSASNPVRLDGMLCLTAENRNLCPFLFLTVENNPRRLSGYEWLLGTVECLHEVTGGKLPRRWTGELLDRGGQQKPPVS